MDCSRWEDISFNSNSIIQGQCFTRPHWSLSILKAHMPEPPFTTPSSSYSHILLGLSLWDAWICGIIFCLSNKKLLMLSAANLPACSSFFKVKSHTDIWEYWWQCKLESNQSTPNYYNRCVITYCKQVCNDYNHIQVMLRAMGSVKDVFLLSCLCLCFWPLSSLSVYCCAPRVTQDWKSRTGMILRSILWKLHM